MVHDRGAVGPFEAVQIGADQAHVLVREHVEVRLRELHVLGGEGALNGNGGTRFTTQALPPSVQRIAMLNSPLPTSVNRSGRRSSMARRTRASTASRSGGTSTASGVAWRTSGAEGTADVMPSLVMALPLAKPDRPPQGPADANCRP